MDKQTKQWMETQVLKLENMMDQLAQMQEKSDLQELYEEAIAAIGRLRDASAESIGMDNRQHTIAVLEALKQEPGQEENRELLDSVIAALKEQPQEEAPKSGIRKKLADILLNLLRIRVRIRVFRQTMPNITAEDLQEVTERLQEMSEDLEEIAELAEQIQRMEDLSDEVEEAAEELLDAAEDAGQDMEDLTESIDDFQEAMETWEESADALYDAADAVQERVRQAWEGIADMIDNIQMLQDTTEQNDENEG